MLTRAADADKFFAHGPEILCLNNRQIYTSTGGEEREEVGRMGNSAGDEAVPAPGWTYLS